MGWSVQLELEIVVWLFFLGWFGVRVGLFRIVVGDRVGLFGDWG